MIERARDMQDDEAQQHIDQNVMDVARFMTPGRAVGRKRGKGDGANNLTSQPRALAAAQPSNVMISTSA